MTYSISGLAVEPFQSLFGLDDDTLAAHGVVRHVAGAIGRYPCRVTLEDAKPGETLLLLNYQHQDADSPYRSSYAIYVNEIATAPRRFVGELPPVLRDRMIALRAFDAAGMLIAAELTQDVEPAIARLFALPEAVYLHAHNAAYGCFAARVDRA